MAAGKYLALILRRMRLINVPVQRTARCRKALEFYLKFIN